MKKINLVGRRFGKLIVVDESGKDKWGQYVWLCKCDCGEHTKVVGGSLRRGITISCGCWRVEMPTILKTTHGLTHSTVYSSWSNMIDRCYNTDNSRFKYYGGRGIKVCDRWRDIVNFHEDMGEKAEGMTIDRINNDGNYEPANCRWATVAEQNRNNGRSIRVKYKGKTKCAAEWSRIIGVHKNTLYHRLRNHPVEIAFNMWGSKC